MAGARLVLTLCAYLGFARKVSSPPAACSMPATPVISISPPPDSTQSSRAAISRSFMGQASGYLNPTERRQARRPVPPRSRLLRDAQELGGDLLENAAEIRSCGRGKKNTGGRWGG